MGTTTTTTTSTTTTTTTTTTVASGRKRRSPRELLTDMVMDYSYGFTVIRDGVEVDPSVIFPSKVEDDVEMMGRSGLNVDMIVSDNVPDVQSGTMSWKEVELSGYSSLAGPAMRQRRDPGS